MTPGTGTPTSSEIKDQLERMLAAARFRNAPNRSDFLALVVRRALQGKKTPGHVIAKDLFPEKPSYHVRVNASNLRKTLKEYQAEEGREDLVLITLPEPPDDPTVKLREGEAYTPQFSYNSIHPVVRELRLGEHFHRRGMFKDTHLALQHFVNALMICPHHREAAIGVVEAWCSLVDWGVEIDEQMKRGPVAHATRILDMEWLSGSSYWRIPALIGRVYMARAEVQQAKDYFAKARKLDRARTESYKPYIEFLINSGDRPKALRLAKKYLDEHPDDIYAYTTCTVALASMEKFAEVASVLELALEVDKSSALVQFYVAQLRIWQRRQYEAVPHVELMKALMDDQTFLKFAPEMAKRLSALPEQIQKKLLLAGPAPK